MTPSYFCGRMCSVVQPLSSGFISANTDVAEKAPADPFRAFNIDSSQISSLEMDVAAKLGNDMYSVRFFLLLVLPNLIRHYF